MMLQNWLLVLLWSASTLFTDDQPEFKGGSDRLNQFIAGSLVYPEFAKQNCLQGTIQVSFKLNKEGKVFGSFVQKGFGVDLDKEALRIVRLTSGKWTVPASYDTTTSLVLPINFSLTEYKCEQRSKDDINDAIAAYQAREGLTKAVVTFYQNKAATRHNPADEQKIEALKTELGYDSKYADRMLKQAQLKLKQGDKESACEDFHFIHNIGSSIADKLIGQYCR